VPPSGEFTAIDAEKLCNPQIDFSQPTCQLPGAVVWQGCAFSARWCHHELRLWSFCATLALQICNSYLSKVIAPNDPYKLKVFLAEEGKVTGQKLIGKCEILDE
jgi:hypothetical protein